MKKALLVTFFSTFCLSLCAATYADNPSDITTNLINYHVSAERWASTNTARVIIAINATLNDNQLGQIHNEILQNLARIAPNTSWHITDFSRSQTQSGLEQLSAQAETRLPDNALANLRHNAVNVSKPGQTYSVLDIDYAPNLADIEQTKELLRNQIYQQTIVEIDALSKIYPNRHYYVHNIDFSNVNDVIPPQPVFRTMAVSGLPQAPQNNLAVSSKIVIRADVVLAVQGQ
jgi:hypothetical protein